MSILMSVRITGRVNQLVILTESLTYSYSNTISYRSRIGNPFSARQQALEMKHTLSSSYRRRPEQAQVNDSVGVLDVLGTNVLREPARVSGHTGIEIVFPHSSRQLKTVVLRTRAEVNHFSETPLVAHQIEKHAPIAVEKICRSSRPPVRSRGGGMHDHVEPSGAEIVPHFPISRFSWATDGANRYAEESCCADFDR
jgi:hypothetical protein